LKKYFIAAAKTSLVLVYLVIIAGALVRLTGSGMGCPDWPKCFGYYIPPTDVKELTWSPNREFESGQVIIKNEKLLVAKSDFNSGEIFNQSQWRPYTKHDYAIFNATETWIEYINRLVGALAGLVVLVMAFLSVWHWKSNKKLTLLSWLTVFFMGVQGWLGAKVVYSVLNPIKITIHMVVALIIVAVLVYIIKESRIKISKTIQNKTFTNILIFTFILTVIQIVLGTQVRQFVDEQVKIFGYNEMWKILENPTVTFYIHRSFSILVLVLNIYLWLKNKKLGLNFEYTNAVMILLFCEILSGMAMYYFDFPYTSQPIHLVIASLLFGFQWFMTLGAFNKLKE
jgi:heme a synthase